MRYGVLTVALRVREIGCGAERVRQILIWQGCIWSFRVRAVGLLACRGHVPPGGPPVAESFARIQTYSSQVVARLALRSSARRFNFGPVSCCAATAKDFDTVGLMEHCLTALTTRLSKVPASAVIRQCRVSNQHAQVSFLARFGLEMPTVPHIVAATLSVPLC